MNIVDYCAPLGMRRSAALAGGGAELPAGVCPGFPSRLPAEGFAARPAEASWGAPSRIAGLACPWVINGLSISRKGRKFCAEGEIFLMNVRKIKKRWQDSEELLKKNPRVSKSVVEQYRDLVQKLEKLGVDTRPRYTLSPWGGSPQGIQKTSTFRIERGIAWLLAAQVRKRPGGWGAC